jgi:hypothetical protein
MKKLTREDFLKKVSARLRGPLDLSKFEYSGSAGKGIAICPVHGEFMISANALMNRIGCKPCSRSESGRKRAMTQEEFILRAAEVHGEKYDYSKVVYINSQKHVTIVCPSHGEFSQSPNAHLRGQGCKKCSNESIGDRCKLTQEEFVSRLEDLNSGYGLELVRYGGMSKSVTLVCKEHGPFSATAGNVLYNKSGCPRCANELTGARSRKPLDYYVEKSRAVHGDRFDYLRVEYHGAAAYLRILCKDHGEFLQLAQDHIKGVGCSKCAVDIYDHPSFINVATRVHGSRYDYSQAVYNKALSKVIIYCKDHGPFAQTPSSHINGQGCPRCANVGPSDAQIEIANFMRQFADVMEEAPIGESRKRVDVFLPEYSLAIEYHGLIWHSSKFKSDPRSDYKKHKQLEALGVRTVHIYEDEWRLRRGVVERTLMSAIGALPRVYARSTELVETSTSEADEFYEINHLQGRCLAEVAYALKEAGEVVACMSFGIARSDRRNTDKTVWELERYAATKTVVGGASKLLKAFLRSGRAKTVVSYSDTRAFSGAMYQALGFGLVSESAPDYKYVNGSYKVGRIHKSKFQRKNLPELLGVFDPTLSEAENCRNNGWYQIFDCGKKKWVLQA